MKGVREQLIFLKLRVRKDPDAFGDLYDEYADKIYRFVYFKVSSKEEAEDITSEVFLKAWQYINSKKKVGNFKALLYRVARNSVIDLYRKRSQSGARREREVELVGDMADPSDMEKDIARKFDMALLKKAMGKLKEENRDALMLRYVEGFSISEISKIMGKSNVAVRVILHRALKSLKTILSDYEL